MENAKERIFEIMSTGDWEFSRPKPPETDEKRYEIHRTN